jgi:hypothetical protein
VKLEAQVELSQAQSAMGQSFTKKRIEILKIASIFSHQFFKNFPQSILSYIYCFKVLL